VAAAYDELALLARARLARAGPVTLLDTTALVHECYLRLLKVGDLQPSDRAHFFGYAGRVMRSIIVDAVRQRSADRRGGAAVHVTLATDQPQADDPAIEELLAIDAALSRLAAFDPRLVQVVELRYFVGLSNQEIAAALDVDERTVRRDWDKARALLHAELQR
jgi:RNA polymerase sigma factor (TIGR02999 family)